LVAVLKSSLSVFRMILLVERASSSASWEFIKQIKISFVAWTMKDTGTKEVILNR
jgi:hypothetical protein